jgi:hypothetical protein
VDLTSEPFATGDAIKLFDAASYAGSFTTIQPATPGAGLAWDVSSLAVNGTLKVVDVPPPAPEIAGVTIADGNVVISGTGGAPGGTYFVLTSTNLALPVLNWTVALTRTFDANGNFNVTNAVDANAEHQFFLLQLP